VTDRGVSTLVGSVALLALTVTLAVVVGATVAGSVGEEPGPRARFSLHVDSRADRIAIEHRGGDAIDVRDLSVRISVDGRSLDRQPSVPFFAASGFVSGPTGPFNLASDPNWTAGERASLAIADTNAPTIKSGDEVRVKLVVDDQIVADLATTADGPLTRSLRGPSVRHDGRGPRPVDREQSVFDVLEPRRGKHPVGLIGVVKEHDGVGDPLEDGVFRVVRPDDEDLSARFDDAPELAERANGTRPVLDRSRRPDHVETVRLERESLRVATIEPDRTVRAELRPGLGHLMGTLVEPVNLVDVFEQPFRGETGATADVQDPIVRVEVEDVDRLVPHRFVPDEGVDPVVHLRQILVEQACAALVLQYSHYATPWDGGTLTPVWESTPGEGPSLGSTIGGAVDGSAQPFQFRNALIDGVVTLS